MITVEETKKAKAIIVNFSNKENELLGYVKELLSGDMQHIIMCEKAMETTDDPAKYRLAISKQSDLSFRAKYIMQIFGIHIDCDFENKKLIIKSPNDK